MSDIVEYARDRNLSPDIVRCKCGLSYETGRGYYARCPRCHDEGGSSLEAQLVDHQRFPGRSFFWDVNRDRWVLLETVAVLPGDSWALLIDTYRSIPRERRQPGASVVLTLAREMEYMRAALNEKSGPDRQRAEELARHSASLADTCGELRADLKESDAEVTALRRELRKAREERGA